MKKCYWIVPVWGSVEPQPMVGPFRTYEGMRRRAVKVHAKQDEEDQIFYMVTQPGRRPQMGTFTEDEISVS